jgi:hypothetical protein
LKQYFIFHDQETSMPIVCHPLLKGLYLLKPDTHIFIIDLKFARLNTVCIMHMAALAMDVLLTLYQQN